MSNARTAAASFLKLRTRHINMPKYHPIDVRYKGPSTAYRGSAKQHKSSFQPTAKASSANEKHHSAASPSPWSNMKEKRQGPATPPVALSSYNARASTSKSTANGPITAKSIYMIIAGIFLLSLFLR
jgi:hypothetical protein